MAPVGEHVCWRVGESLSLLTIVYSFHSHPADVNSKIVLRLFLILRFAQLLFSYLPPEHFYAFLDYGVATRVSFAFCHCGTPVFNPEARIAQRDTAFRGKL